jgi:hypothetical protein
MSGTVVTDHSVFNIVGSELCRATIQGKRDCAYIFITLLTVPYLRQQYKRNAF